jgi:tetratricopeptide (TPR) repeat protein
VKKLPDCKTLAESRLAFAREIHKCELYDQCLEILNPLLARSPDWTPALTCKADTLVRLQRFDEALLVASRALELDSANADAWKARGDVFECQENWEALLQNTDAWERSGRHPRSSQRELLLHRAVAYCAVDRIPEMEAAIAAHLTLFSFKTQEIAERRRSNAYFRVFRRAGKPAPEQFPSVKP